MTVYFFVPLIATLLFWLLIVSASLRSVAKRGVFSEQPAVGIVLSALLLVFSWLLSGALVPLTNLPVILINQLSGTDLYLATIRYTVLHWIVVLMATTGVAFMSHYIIRITTGVTWRMWAYQKPSITLLTGIAILLGLGLLVREGLMPVFHQLTPAQSLPFIR